MEQFKSLLGRQSDLVLVLGVIGILLILFAPVPPSALDLLIIVNFAFAMTILLLTFYVDRPVDFSTFPSLLLLATLFRLSLNVAATRLILSSANGGEVIGAVGAFVVQGNFVIGLIVFFILVVVQYVVVTSGAQRVSEVAARFTLDAMPGQQMSIDADLNMGLITQDEAKARRKSLEKEAGFYGAMDGASKFVKGDAIAGIVILLINIIGGLVIGVMQMGMPWQEALQRFTLLTIGDGIVTQVPALIISVATGIIVTRSAADQKLSSEVLRQLVRFPKIQLVVMATLIALFALPGMPKWPVAILLVVVIGVWLLARRRAGTFEEALAEGGAEAGEGSDADVPVVATGIEVTFAKGLADTWLPMRQVLIERVASLRRQHARDTGITIPAVTFAEATLEGYFDYQILLRGDRYGAGTLYPDKTLAIRASTRGDSIEGVATRDPAFQLPAVWIDPAQAEAAQVKGYTLVDPITVLVTHLTEVIRNHGDQLLSRNEVVQLLEGTRGRQPGLVEELVPNVLAISDVQRVLQHLVAEHVSVRNIDVIIEVLADAGRHQKDPALLAEAVRGKLGLSICQRLAVGDDTLSVLTLDPALESSIVQNLQQADGGAPGFVLESRLAEGFLSRLMSLTENMMRQNLMPVLLCSPEIRRQIKVFSGRAVPRLSVLSIGEIPGSMKLKSFAVVSLQNSVDGGKLA
ncbi:flagellar biosynthesis protein FlhA [Cupriavidus basilensis]|uniref:Flagellar biosynthesis protein FlhA n=1 Tax=Cupriavidus basilensis TaxID=68895 RepID=A0ABT6AW34_9BURK|nr:flagellar biosynthesis protein FlhA [Cupriavidus basilensis]MDF3836839.1 flagellar biosynthesis protein FlhA [Cupriavidus basilensis]